MTDLRRAVRSPASRVSLAALAVVGVVAAALLLYATRTWGLGVSYDSVVYIQGSHDLSAIPLPQPRDHGGEPLYWWAPVYPLALKLVGGTYDGARFLNAFLLLVGAILVGALAWKSIGRRAGVVAGALYAFSPAVFVTHLNLLAEPLFLVLATLSLGLMAFRHPTAAGLAAAAATLTRYAGLPLILTGALVLRGRDRLWFLAASLTPYALWIVRNELTAGEASGRQLRWHPLDWSIVERALRTTWHIFVTDGAVPSLTLPLVDAGLILQVVAVAAIVFALARADRSGMPPLVSASLVYAALYCGFLVLTVSVFDAGTPVDVRLLAPLVPSIVFTLAWLMRQTPIAAVALVCVFGIVTLQEARTVSLYGLDYSGRIWSAASFDGVSLPPGPLRSNWPAAVAYFTGRSPDRLPKRIDGHTLDVSKSYERDLRELATATRNGKMTLVLLSDGFLQISPSGTPLADTAPFAGLCHPATTVITICRRR